MVSNSYTGITGSNGLRTRGTRSGSTNGISGSNSGVLPVIPSFKQNSGTLGRSKPPTSLSPGKYAVSILLSLKDSKPKFAELWPVYLLDKALEDSTVQSRFQEVLNMNTYDLDLFRQSLSHRLKKIPNDEVKKTLTVGYVDDFIDYLEEQDIENPNPANIIDWLLIKPQTMNALFYLSGLVNDSVDEKVLDGILSIQNQSGRTQKTGFRPVEKKQDRETNAPKTIRSSQLVSQPKKLPDFSELEYIDLLAKAEQKLKTKILCQDKAIDELVDAFGVHYIDQKERPQDDAPSKPNVRALLYGPSGVGKTSVANLLSSTLDRPVLLKAMNECVDEQSATEFKGAQVGLVGHMNGTSFPERLEELIQNSPRPPIIIFDEFEKAHKSIYYMIMRLLDEGKISKANGEDVDAKGVDIILTTNAGLKSLNEAFKNGKRGQELENITHDAMSKEFPIEVLNRMSNNIFFQPLDKSDIKVIINNKLKTLVEDYKQRRNLDLQLDLSAKNELLQVASSSEGGVRKIDDKIRESILVPMIKHLTRNDAETKLAYCNKTPMRIKIGFDNHLRKFTFLRQ